uniref:Uncharacterized protein n=1 Tax=Arundo donax TaxID=35708 RepID=A0A0A9BII9_ARUDO
MSCFLAYWLPYWVWWFSK